MTHHIMACKLPGCYEPQEDKIAYKLGIWVFKNHGPPKPLKVDWGSQAKPSRDMTGSIRVPTPRRPLKSLTPHTETCKSMNPCLGSLDLHFCIIHLNFSQWQLDVHFSTPENASSEFIERRPENETQGKCNRYAVNTGRTAKKTIHGTRLEKGKQPYSQRFSEFTYLNLRVLKGEFLNPKPAMSPMFEALSEPRQLRGKTSFEQPTTAPKNTVLFH